MSFRYIDIHTHLNLDAFSNDEEDVAKHTLQEGVAYINVGTGTETSKRAIELAHASVAGVYATVGLHPVNAGGGSEVEHAEDFDSTTFRTLAMDEKVVAIGECGFDYFRIDKETKVRQEEVFYAHIMLANEFGKPLMLHVRDVAGEMGAYEDALSMIKTYAKGRGNVHFFAGTYDIAKQFWDMGFTTSFTGVITFAHQYDEVIQSAPIEMLHAETDAPYVAPIPFRGKRNEPLHVREVYKRIAEIRGEDEENVRVALLKNAERVFGITL